MPITRTVINHATLFNLPTSTYLRTIGTEINPTNLPNSTYLGGIGWEIGVLPLIGVVGSASLSAIGYTSVADAVGPLSLVASIAATGAAIMLVPTILLHLALINGPSLEWILHNPFTFHFLDWMIYYGSSVCAMVIGAAIFGAKITPTLLCLLAGDLAFIAAAGTVFLLGLSAVFGVRLFSEDNDPVADDRAGRPTINLLDGNNPQNTENAIIGEPRANVANEHSFSPTAEASRLPRLEELRARSQQEIDEKVRMITYKLLMEEQMENKRQQPSPPPLGQVHYARFMTPDRRPSSSNQTQLDSSMNLC